MVIKKKTKKVLLGFVTTSFILLVMIAPTTTAAASLQQQEDNETSSAAVNATIDDPFIPIGPTEGEKEPDEPIPDNENETDDDDDNSTGTISCKDIGYPFGGVDEYPDVPYCPGQDDDDDNDGNITCLVSAGDQEQPCAGFCDHGACAKIGPENDTDDNPDTWINWVKTTADGRRVSNGGVVYSNKFKVDFQSTATDTGKGSHVDLKIDDDPYDPVASPKEFTILGTGYHTIYLKGVDKNGNEDPTPVKFSFTIQKPRTDSDDDYPDTWINSVRTPEGKNIPNGGSTSSKVVTVDFQGTVSGPGSHIDLKIDSGSYVPVASPRTITGLSDGPHTICLKAVNQAGKADPTPACWKFTVINDNDD